jgi:hypothetical protein
MEHVYFEQCVSTEKIFNKIYFVSSSADQVFGDEEMHATVRQNCMDYVVSYFSSFD